LLEPSDIATQSQLIDYIATNMKHTLLTRLTLALLWLLASAKVDHMMSMQTLETADNALDKRADTYWLSEVADHGKASADRA
jgi:hypothetical protein